MSEELEAREIAAEQTYVDEVYVQLDASMVNAQALATEGRNRGKLEHEGGLVERDAMVFQAAKRIAQLDAAHEGLVFGRLDLDPSIDAEPRYIGRIGVRNADRDVLLIDWRAPAAGVFYQATAAAPSATKVVWSSGTRWCSRRPAGSPSSTPPTRGWCSAGSTCATRSTPGRATSAGSDCATSTATRC